MQVEPAADAFAARYAAGEPQAVWTTLVADLETPVSAFLKITGAQPKLLRRSAFCSSPSRAARSAAGIRSSDLSPTSFSASTAEIAEINRAPQNNPVAFTPAGAPPLQALRALIAESRIALPDLCRQWPPASSAISATTWCGRWRIPWPRHVLIRSAFPTPSSSGRRWSWCSMRLKIPITVVTPVRPRAGVTAKAARAHAVERLSAIVDALERPLDKSAGGQRSRLARGDAALQHHAGRVQSAWCCAPRSTSSPATFFRSCCRSVSRRRSRCRRSRFIARCGASILRPICFSSTSAPSR